MKPVFQTILCPPRGNCFAACIASIFEVSLADVPRFEGENWCDNWRTWLRRSNIDMLVFDVREENDEFTQEWNDYWTRQLVIAGVQSPRFDCLHAVVMRQGRIVHDPWPGPNSFKKGDRPKIRDYMMFCPVVIMKPMRIVATGEFASWHEPEGDEGELPSLAAD